MNTRLPVLFVMATSAMLAQDPPSRVARLNWVQGAVSFQPSTLDTWTSATVNYPLTTGDHLYTDRRARAEMHVGANAIRLEEESNFGFLNLDDSTVQMRFTEGALQVHLRDSDFRDIWEVDTPNGAISLLRAGDYRIDTDPNRNATMVTVTTGEAEVMNNGRVSLVRARETGYFSDDRDPDIRNANNPDDFDRFVSGRNQSENRLSRSGHVPANVGGYEDLDRYGAWQDVPEYGWAWTPPVDVNWVPYRDGRWAWVEPWGWTWVDDAPWGFAPFHYGRWVTAGGRWVWIPGAFDTRPVYAPALVVFAGGWGSGNVAWFPLGPREYYRPGYRVSQVYERNVNIGSVTNTTNITNTTNNIRYINRNVPGAAVAVSQEAFTSGRSVPSAATRMSAQQLAGAQMSNSAPLPPRRESVFGGGRTGVNIPRPPDPVMSRQVVVRAVPPSPAVSFEARRPQLERNQGRPLAPEEVIQLRRQQPADVINRTPMRSADPAIPIGRPGFDRTPDRTPDRIADPVRPRLDSRPRDVIAPPRQFPDRRQLPQVLPVPPVPQQTRPTPDSQPVPDVIAPPRQFPERRQYPQTRPVPDSQPVPQVPQQQPVPERRPYPQTRPVPDSQPVPQVPQQPAQVRPQFPQGRPMPDAQPQQQAVPQQPQRPPAERRMPKRDEQDQ